MAKNKKTKLKDPIIRNEKPESTEGLKKLKVGMEVMYRTPYLFDKCSVTEVDKSDDIAILSNQVKVSRGILPNGNLLKIGQTTEATEIRLWDESTEIRYKAFMATRKIRNFHKVLERILGNCSDEDLIKLNEKLEKIETKYGAL